MNRKQKEEASSSCQKRKRALYHSIRHDENPQASKQSDISQNNSESSTTAAPRYYIKVSDSGKQRVVGGRHGKLSQVSGIHKLFPAKLWNVLVTHREEFKHIVSWRNCGRGISIWKPRTFIQQLWSNRLNSSKTNTSAFTTTFTRQMNLYKFRYIRTKADTVEADTAAALSSRKNRFFSDDTPIHYDHATFANSLTSLEEAVCCLLNVKFDERFVAPESMYLKEDCPTTHPEKVPVLERKRKLDEGSTFSSSAMLANFGAPMRSPLPATPESAWRTRDSFHNKNNQQDKEAALNILHLKDAFPSQDASTQDRDLVNEVSPPMSTEDRLIRHESFDMRHNSESNINRGTVNNSTPRLTELASFTEEENDFFSAEANLQKPKHELNNFTSGMSTTTILQSVTTQSKNMTDTRSSYYEETPSTTKEVARELTSKNVYGKTNASSEAEAEGLPYKKIRGSNGEAKIPKIDPMCSYFPCSLLSPTSQFRTYIDYQKACITNFCPLTGRESRLRDSMFSLVLFTETFLDGSTAPSLVKKL